MLLEAARPAPDATVADAADDFDEINDWLDALESVVETAGPDRARTLLTQLQLAARRHGAATPTGFNTPYVNTIPAADQPEFPGNRTLERKIKSLLRWNAMAMVARGHNGGHIATYASAATLYEVGFNHFFKGPDAPGGGDQVFYQGHSSPGIYARSFLEGRFDENVLKNFRHELAAGGGLSSYPHPWLMPDYWQFATVSMGLGPLLAIYQARFNRYLEHRGLKDTSKQHVWCFIGDGETDEPETLGSITLAAREKLDNLTFIINCNLQRLDGPVRGNGKIIQELEAVFHGAGWNVIKVVWGSEWDPLFEADTTGLLAKRLGEVVDGEYQKYAVEGPAYMRLHLFGKYPELLDLVKDIPDDKLARLKRGGHDPLKVYAAYHAALHNQGRPTVILAKTIKGYGLGEAGEARNTTHQMKSWKTNPAALRKFRATFDIPVPESELEKFAHFRPAEHSEEVRYARERRAALGGPVPARVNRSQPLKAPPLEAFQGYLGGSGQAEVSTTGAFVSILKDVLLRDKEIGQRIVPIIPDEARTFGMDSMFKPFGIYSNVGQLYEPVDSKFAVSYREAKNGIILEEGITEAGAMSSFIAAGSSYSTHGHPMIPFYIYYSMFGFQRFGDLAWAAGDMRVRGFLLGATAGRTTLNGEGLQHQDGQSHVQASVIPNCILYDPAYAYEVAVILQDGIRRMYQDCEDVYYYLTLQNEAYLMPPMPSGAGEGILKGLYKIKPSGLNRGPKVHLFGSAVILREALRAQELLDSKYGVAADVWSVTSYRELRRDAAACERWNLLHPEASPRKSFLEKTLEGESGVFVAASDYIRQTPEMIARWVPGGLYCLGTDGFGRSDDRAVLRRHFEVDAECITVAALAQLAKRKEVKPALVAQAIKDLGVNPEKVDPAVS